MDLIVLQILLISSYGCFVKADIKTIPSIEAYMNHQLTLTCDYTSTNGPSHWMFIRWQRYVNDTVSIPLVTMQNTIFSPDWADTAPANFKDHVETLKTVTNEGVSLNLKIDGFKCTDEGTYVCQVFTMGGDLGSKTTIKIKAHPGTPRIVEDNVEVAENGTFTILCTVNVGIPPQVIRWSYQLKDRDVVELVSPSIFTQVNTPASDCTSLGESTVELTMTPLLDGAVYMCYATNDLGKDGKPLDYDAVRLEMLGKTTTTLAPPSTTTVLNTDETRDNSAIKSSSSTAALLSFVVLINLLTPVVSGS